MAVDPFDIFGGYVDGYCQPAPASGLVHFYHAAGQVSFTRLPGYPQYRLVFDQAREEAGNEPLVYAPFAQELLIKLPWPRMFQADRDALETFHRSVVRGACESFTYSNNALGPSLPVRFAEAGLPVMPEVAPGQYQVELTLRVDINYPQLTAVAGAPPAVAGHRFLIGGLAFPFPAPLLGGSGSGSELRQSAGRNSAGELIIYDRARKVRRLHTLVLSHDYDGFIMLQALFFTFAQGGRRLITWVDAANVSRTVRLSGNTIAVQQLAYNRFSTTLELEEVQ